MSTYSASVFRVPPHDFSPTVEVAACYLEVGGKFLFLKRSLSSPQANTWGVPGGKFEEREAPREAVLRETFEEVGIRLDEKNLDYVGKVFVRYPHVDFVYHMFHIEFPDFPLIRLSDEHQDFRWLTFQESYDEVIISGGNEVSHHFQALAKKPKLPRREFYFLRHGETEVNANYDPIRADYDLPLNAKGREQAALSRESIARCNFKSVCHSPLQRAIETKNIATHGHNVNVYEINELRECKAAVWDKMVTLINGRGYHLCETVEQFFVQSMKGIQSAVERDELTLIVAHGGVHWAMCYQLMIEDHPWDIGNCRLVHFQPSGETDWRAKIIS